MWDERHLWSRTVESKCAGALQVRELTLWLFDPLNTSWLFDPLAGSELCWSTDRAEVQHWSCPLEGAAFLALPVYKESLFFHLFCSRRRRHLLFSAGSMSPPAGGAVAGVRRLPLSLSLGRSNGVGVVVAVVRGVGVGVMLPLLFGVVGRAYA